MTAASGVSLWRSQARHGLRRCAAVAVTGFGILLATVSAAAGGGPKPMHVVSMNQCTDQLVLMLLPPQRIASVTYLASDGAVSEPVRRLAAQVGVNHGLAEEVLVQKPDLVFAEPFTTPATRRLARQAHVPMVEIDAADDYDDIRRITRQVAAAVGEPERGEALIARMDAALQQLDRTRPPRPIPVLGWSASGEVPGKRTLFNAILAAAGGVNLAAAPGFRRKTFTLEELIALRPQPDLLLYGEARKASPDLETQALRHPILEKAFGRRRLTYPEAAYRCGTPQAADQAVELRRSMLDALAQAGRP